MVPFDFLRVLLWGEHLFLEQIEIFEISLDGVICGYLNSQR